MADQEETWHLSRAVPVSIIGFLLVQTLGIVAWATRLDQRVVYLENKETQQDHRLDVLETLLPKLAVIEARQGDVIKRLDGNSDKLEQILNLTRQPK